MHLTQHQVDVYHLEIDVGLACWICADRHQIVRAAHLHAMTCVVEQCDVGALNLAAEGLNGDVETGLVEIELSLTADERETEASERLGHQQSVVFRIIEACNVLICRIADHQRNAILGRGRTAKNCRQEANQRQKFETSEIEKKPAHPR